LTTVNQEVNERTAEEDNDNAVLNTSSNVCFTVAHLNTNIFVINKNLKPTHIGILITKFGTFVFFCIVPIPPCHQNREKIGD